MHKFHEQAGQVVFTFGRFNPPTTGHEKLLDKVKQIAGSSRYVVYPSQSQNQKKDPLPFALKVAYMRKMFPKHSRNIMADKKVYNAFDIVVKLYNEKYTDIAMVVGSDRVKEFKSILDKYNGVTGKRHGFYKFRSISVISAGERDPDAEGVTGMSASKMRAAASLGDFESFKLGLPKGFKEGQKLFDDVRKYMGIREERDMGLMTDYEELRDAYLTGEVWNIDDLIEANGVVGKIIRRGTNYVAFVDENNKVHKAWLHEINVNENPFAGGLLDPTPLLRKVRGKLDSRIISNVIKRYMDGVDKGRDKGGDPRTTGRNSKNRLIADIVQVYGLERKYGMGMRDIANYINKLVSKGRLDRKYTVEQKKITKVKQDKDVKGSPGSEPAKYFAKGAGGKGMSKSTKQARARYFDKKAKMSDDNPDAYKPAPGDKDKKTKPSQYTKKFKQMYGEKLGKDADMGDYIKDFQKSDSPQFKGKSKEKRKDMAIAAYLSRNEDMDKLDEKIAGLVKKSKQTGVPYGILKKSYDRGMAAWKTGHRPGTTPQQWAFARVNSMLTGGKADPDLQPQARAAKKKKKAAAKKENFSSVQEWFESNITRAKYQMHHGDDWWWKMNEVHDKLLEKLDESCCEDCINEGKKRYNVKQNVGKSKFVVNFHDGKKKHRDGSDFFDINIFNNKKDLEKFEKELKTKGFIKEQDMPCPPSTKDIKLNTKNRDATIKNHNYGPLNVDEPGDYWKDIAKYWKTTEEAAKKSICNNCVAFDVSPRMLECMPGETSDEDGRLGYCHMHHFKCHSARACHTWAKGGPIDTDEKSYDWQERGQKKENYKESLWANIHKKRQRIKQGSGERMRKKGEKGAPTPAQLKRAKGEGLQNFSQFQLRNAWGEVTEKAEYQGRPVELNNPTRGDTKKFKVYVKNDKGNVVKVEYGDPNMSIKRDDPERRKSFRARHNCDNPGPKYKARYWSCKFWSTKSVTDLMKG